MDDPIEVPIRKLHGSINWQSYAGEATSQKVKMDLLYKTAQRCIYAFPDVTICPYGSSGEMPVLVPPTASKEYRGVYEWMWAYAGLDIPAADKLAIVGYSFPLLDVFAERHLLPMLRERSGSLLYVLPKCPALDRVRDLLRERDVTFVEEKWRIEHFDGLL